ncbi:MAG: DUF4266 domain-containing protein [Vicinamibacteria bacterium]|nr:DUF4266 domain-containing protein [Vicinamibacteria bacterium]
MPRSSRKRRVGLLARGSIVIALATLGGGCATVKPWQRGRLADACMTFEANAGLSAYAAHWQESREGSSGGAGVQGGGCGCK